MKNVFVNTKNINAFDSICRELEDPESMIGPSLAMVTGPAGRGKSEAAKHYAASSSAIYLPPLNIRSASMLLREITFELCKIKPRNSETCLNLIGDELGRERRLVIIDEADLLAMPVLEMLRGLNERYSCPILLIGEDELKTKVTRHRRIASRIRQKMEFTPVIQPDIALFFQKSLGVEISAGVMSIIHHRSHGDWRPVLTVAIGIERAMKASGLKEITDELANDICKNT
ncbi:MAG: ATP-binding protein [Pseudomonadota bacterium]